MKTTQTNKISSALRLVFTTRLPIQTLILLWDETIGRKILALRITEKYTWGVVRRYCSYKKKIECTICIPFHPWHWVLNIHCFLSPEESLQEPSMWLTSKWRSVNLKQAFGRHWMENLVQEVDSFVPDDCNLVGFTLFHADKQILVLGKFEL
jgi:hypothetical protein